MNRSQNIINKLRKLNEKDNKKKYKLKRGEDRCKPGYVQYPEGSRKCIPSDEVPSDSDDDKDNQEGNKEEPEKENDDKTGQKDPKEDPENDKSGDNDSEKDDGPINRNDSLEEVQDKLKKEFSAEKAKELNRELEKEFGKEGFLEKWDKTKEFIDKYKLGEVATILAALVGVDTEAITAEVTKYTWDLPRTKERKEGIVQKIEDLMLKYDNNIEEVSKRMGMPEEKVKTYLAFGRSIG